MPLLLTTIAMAALVTAGFLPTARALALVVGFPLATPILLALPLYWAGRARAELAPPLESTRLGKTFAAPILIALAFGFLSPTGALTSARDWLWYGFVAPLVEELLFRGWLFGFIARATASRPPPMLSPPFPASVWLSSLGFSLWHLQNWPRDSAALVSIQVTYTFFTGLWLGYLRWRTGGIGAPIVAHAAVNVATGAGAFFAKL